MRLMVVSAAFLAFIFTTAMAGFPIQQEVKCPIGGRNVQVTSTPSCSYFGEHRRMSFWTPSSCDFITRLPVCRGNKFPIYKEFSDDEVKRLKKFVRTADYRDLKAESRYFRAYEIDRFLSPDRDEAELFDLLLEGLWYDARALTYDVSDYMSAFMRAGTKVSDADRDGNAFASAIFAYYLYRSKRPEEAAPILERLRGSQVYKDQEVLQDYVEAIDACIKKTRIACEPDARIFPSEDE
ncbi:MAG: hypothetical protein AAGJ73_01535 [Pseudomonadota bacterium]